MEAISRFDRRSEAQGRMQLAPEGLITSIPIPRHHMTSSRHYDARRPHYVFGVVPHYFVIEERRPHHVLASARGPHYVLVKVFGDQVIVL